MTRSIGGVLAALLLVLSTPAFAGDSRLLNADRKEPDLRGYERVEVVTLVDASNPTFDKAEEEQAYRATVAEGGKHFADLIVAALTTDKGFAQVGREAGPGKGIKVGGKITVYKESNVAARYIGLGIGGSAFAATIEVSDAESGNALGSMTVDLGSSPLPGATNTVQTVRFLMASAAQAVSDELRIAKHAVHREDTGHSGREREKYKKKSKF